MYIYMSVIKQALLTYMAQIYNKIYSLVFCLTFDIESKEEIIEIDSKCDGCLWYVIEK